MRKEFKTFIGGGVIGLIIGTVVGCVAMLLICGTAFINYELKNSNSVGKITTTIERTNK
jgi:hypothetical protein